MTDKEFDNAEFVKGMRVKFGVFDYEIISVDFEDRSIEIETYNDNFVWVPCRKLQIIK